MGKVIISENASLDAVMQSPGPTDVPFKYRGWAVDFGRGPDGTFDFEKDAGLPQLQAAGALLLGRVTFEAMQASWPKADGALADKLNALPKYVVSSTLTKPGWNATVLGDDWLRDVAKLRKELTGDIIVYGSLRLARTLIANGLADELSLLVYPLLLGAGARLFEETDDKIPLQLIKSRALGGGVMLTTYALRSLH